MPLSDGGYRLAMARLKESRQKVYKYKKLRVGEILLFFVYQSGIV